MKAIEKSGPSHLKSVKIRGAKDALTLTKELEEGDSLLALIDTSSVDDNMGMIEIIEKSFKKNKGVSMLLGYGSQRNSARLLQANATNVTAAEINSTGIGGLATGIFACLIAVFGFVMMGNIQTPKSFAKKDLVKGRINR